MEAVLVRNLISARDRDAVNEQAEYDEGDCARYFRSNWLFLLLFNVCVCTAATTWRTADEHPKRHLARQISQGHQCAK